ncbi:MAG: AraC family transcriptional regulator [Clostridiales bacterium]|nr:AraC family transcriptional regulator [Clostridiales bacterium]
MIDMMPTYEYYHEYEYNVYGWIAENSAVDIGMHIHSMVEYVYVENGRIDVTVNGQSRILTAGEIMIAASYSVHSIKSLGDSKCYVVLASLSCFSEPIFTEYRFENIYVTDSDSQSLLMLFKLISFFDSSTANGVAELYWGDKEKKQSPMQQLACVLTDLIIKQSTIVKRERVTEPIAATVDYILKHYKSKLRLSDISKAMFTNSQMLSLQFKRVMNVSISDFIASLRTIEAYRLLIDSPDMTLSEVMELSGFQSTRSMYRCIKEQYGMTPCEIRLTAAKK